MTFAPDQTAAFEHIFDRAAPLIRNVHGCTRLELWRDIDDPNVYTTFSVWNSAEDLQAYRASNLFRETWARTKRLFAAPPTASSYEIAGRDNPTFDVGEQERRGQS